MVAEKNFFLQMHDTILPWVEVISKCKNDKP